MRSAPSEFDPQAWLVRLKRLSRHVGKHFSEDRCFEEAASLSYTSLLALVPLLAVVFGIVSAFPVFRDWSAELKSFVFDNLMPAAGVQVDTYLNTFLQSATGLTLAGTVLLILTALVLMFRIEVAFNRIWRVDRARSLGNRIVMYWAVLTLAPLLIGSAIAVSVQNFIAPLTSGLEVSAVWYRLGIFLVSWITFTLMFAVIPNRSVRFHDAAIGALLSAILFEIAKLAFVTYITNANYAVIYGALATVPIFLVWLYLVWVVILLGASLAASLTTFEVTEERRGDWPAQANFQLAFRTIGHLQEVQMHGGRLSDTELLQREPRAGERQLLDLLRSLEAALLVARDEAGNWVLVRDLDDVTLRHLYLSGCYYLPVGDRDSLLIENDWDREFAATLDAMGDGGRHGMDRSLRSMLHAHRKEKT